MRRRILTLVAATSLALAMAPPALAAPDERVTVDNAVGSYVRYDGGSDETLERCSEGQRQQNEPTVAVNPNDTDVVVAGSNDYCAAIVNNEVWAGYYRSENGGTTWTNSLLPGYPGDESEAGLASPLHGTCGAAGDPTQSFDADGNLFYGFICFNRAKPINGGVYVAKYTDDGATYDRTTLVKRGTPSGQFQTGAFQDKINLTVDQTDGEHGGNVYVAWSQYHAFGPNNGVLFSRSTDGGVSFDRSFRVTPVEHGTGSFTDLAVGPDGTVWLTYLTYASSSRPTTDVWLLSSTDGGASFGAPEHVASISRFDSDLFTGGTGGVDCGDGPFACPSGFVFSRFFSNSAVAADEDGAHVVWAGRLANGQSKVWTRTFADGTWSDAATIDTVATGHQWMPDVASADGTITVVFYDSRTDPGYAPDRPPGNTATGTNSGDVVHTWMADFYGWRSRVERDADHRCRGWKQLRLDDARLAAGRLLGRLHLRLGRPGCRERRVDRFAGPGVGDRSARRCRRRGVLGVPGQLRLHAQRHQRAGVHVADDRRPVPGRGGSRPEHLRGARLIASGARPRMRARPFAASDRDQARVPGGEAGGSADPGERTVAGVHREPGDRARAAAEHVQEPVAVGEVEVDRTRRRRPRDTGRESQRAVRARSRTG